MRLGTKLALQHVDVRLHAHSIASGYRACASAAAAFLRRLLFLLFVTTAVALSAIGSAQADVQYIYDEAGRLTGVVAPSGNAARYTYDAAGNITAISSTVSGTVSIIEFSPNSGPIGTVVTIWGTGFSATPASNTVKFNGTTATVSSASVNKLVVTVPSGATTGTISVTSPGGSATSAQTFTVTANTGLPTITSFTPTIGAVGTAVTVTGTNYRTVAADNALRFNQTNAVVSTATATQLQTNVPVLGTSGPISVTTPVGGVTSTADFFVVPSGKTASDIGFTGRAAVDGADVVATLSTANKIGLVVFSATQGQVLRVIVSPVTFSSVNVSVYSPYGAQVASASSITSAGETLIIFPVPNTGTYTIRVEPGAATGSATLSVKNAVALALDGSTLPISLTRSGEKGVYTFTNTVAGKWVGLGLSSIAFTPPSGSPYVYANIYNANGVLVSTVTPNNCTSWYAPSGRCGARFLPIGTYVVEIDPFSTVTASMTLTLSSDATATITANGSAQNFSTSRIGQQGHYSFDANTVGQAFSVLLTSSTFPSAGTVYVIGPNNTWLGGLSTTFTASGAVLDIPPITTTGTYHIYVVPANAEVGAVSVALKTDDTGPLNLDGTPRTIALAAGQNGRYTFSGTAGAKLGIGVSGLSTTPSGGSVYFRVNKPDGTQLTSCGSASAPGFQCDVDPLPTSGTYTVIVDPNNLVASNLTLTVSTDVSGALTVNGAPLTFSTTRVGQNARYTFTGTATQNYSVMWTGSTFAGDYTFLTVYKPDGSYLNSTFVNAAGLANGTLDLVNVPTSGTYTVFVSPYGTSTGQIAVSVTGDATGSLTINGTPTAVSLAAGQNGRYTFSGTAGQNLGLGVSSLTTTPSGYSVAVRVLKPDGNVLTYCPSASAPGDQCDVTTLPTTGTYTVLLDTDSIAASSMTVTLSTDIPGTALTVNGTAQTFSTARVGQNGRYTFSATSGQSYSLVWSGSTFAGDYTWIYVYKPDGSYWSSALVNATGAASGTLNLGSAPTTGTYTVFITPYRTSTGQVTVRPTNP